MTISNTLISQLKAREDNMGLPGAFYHDQTVYQADLDMLWYKSWIFAGHTFELTDADSVITFILGDYNITISKLNGELIASCEATNTDSTEKRNIHCNVVETYIFISLAESPDDFNAFSQAVTPYIAPHQLGELKVAYESSIIEDGNWKLVIENNRECYHCASNHAELVITYPEDPKATGISEDNVPESISEHWEKCEAVGVPSQFYIDDTGTYRVSRIPLVIGSSYTMDGEDAVSKRLNDFGGENIGALVFFHYPNTWNHFLGDHVVSFRLTPLGPQKTQVTTKWLVRKDAVEGTDYDVNRLTEVWTATNAQDKHLVEENQKGINSPLYEPGPYSVLYEGGVIQFIDWYNKTLLERIEQN